MSSFRRSLMLLPAGLLAVVAACHQAKPATPVSAAAYEAQTDRSADQDRASRDLPGYAPSAKPARIEPAAWPAPAPTPSAESSDDPMRQFDLP